MIPPRFIPVLLLLSAAARVTADGPCRGNYTWWPGLDGSPDGYCMSILYDLGDIDEPAAEAYCKAVGSFGPSIHNDKELAYWSDMTDVLGIDHFWLGLLCPAATDPYRWTDGTRTDYRGPNKELSKCDKAKGYHIHEDGFHLFFTTEDHPPVTDPNDGTIFSSAHALCVYPFTYYEPTTEAPEEDKTTTGNGGWGGVTTRLTTKPPPAPTTTTTTTTPAPTTTTSPLPDLNDAYCSCNLETLYLDVVFVLDNSADMTAKNLQDAISTIETLLFGMKQGTAMFQAQVGIVTFADKMVTVGNFGDFVTDDEIYSLMDIIPHVMAKATTMTSAIRRATGMISSQARSFTRGVMVLMSSSYNQLDEANIIEAAAAFQDNGGILISIDCSSDGSLLGMKRIASPGYYVARVTIGDDQLIPYVLYAMCDANCFCSNGLTPYDSANDRGTPQGCYHVSASAAVFDTAEHNCDIEGGFVATIHDAQKNFFMISSLFEDKRPFWIGYERRNGEYKWLDNSQKGFTNWASGNPTANQDCVYSQKSNGLNSMWYSADCRDPLKAAHLYACQLRPCDSTYDCW